MKTLEEIKDNYAIEQGFENWHEIKKAFRNKEITFLKFGRYENKVFELIQVEQQKLIAENADTKMERYNDLQDVVVVDKSSIINENNIIK